MEGSDGHFLGSASVVDPALLVLSNDSKQVGSLIGPHLSCAYAGVCVACRLAAWFEARRCTANIKFAPFCDFNVANASA